MSTTFTLVALAPAEAKELIQLAVTKVEKVNLDLKGIATSIDELQPLLATHKPQAILITAAFAEQADAIREGVHAFNKDVHIIAIPKDKTGVDAIEWLKTQFPQQ